MKFEILSNNAELFNYLENHPDYTVWHTLSWIKMRINSRFIADAVYFIVRDENQISAGGIVQLVKKGVFFKSGYIQGGFLFNKADEQLFKCIKKGLSEISKVNKLICIDIDSVTEYSEAYNSYFSSAGKNIKEIKKPVIPRFTNIVSLEQKEDEILNQMKSKGRYNIKLAQKKSVTVRKSGSNEDIEKFYEMLIETTSRDGFRPNSIGYYKAFMGNIENAVLLLAEHDNEIIAGGIFTYTKDQALYYYGASSNNKRSLMAPYLVQWHGMLLGIESKCRYYDFMGIADPDNENDPLQGVTEFKLKFGGRTVVFNKSYRIISSNSGFLLFNILKSAGKLRKIFS